MTRSLADLAFRRQFYLGPMRPALALRWTQFDIGPKLRLYAHPDLEVTQLCKGDSSVTLLGFALDPARPEASTREILAELEPLSESVDGIVAGTSKLGGRWVLTVHRPGQTWIMHDATGARQVCYTRVEDTTVCASQASLIAEVHGISIDMAAQSFVRARGDSDLDVYWLPGDRTLYGGVRALLPNHLLDVTGGEPVRIWPAGTCLPAGDPSAVLERSAAVLKGLVAAARKHATLAVPMTAGLDSRLVLAMCRAFPDELYCYTFVYPNQSWRHPDVAVPSRLLARLGIAHHAFDYPRAVDDAYRAVCRRSAYNGHDAFCADGQILLQHYPQGALCLTGDVAEIVKCHYRSKVGDTRPITAATLAELSGVPPTSFALSAFRDWLEGVPAVLPIPLLDLFCWEQMAGRWQAMIRTEYDVVQESLAPLNCRALLLDILSVEEALRCRPHFTFFTELIERLWPLTLEEPINPPEKVTLAREAVRLVGRLNLQKLLGSSVRERLRQAVRRI